MLLKQTITRLGLSLWLVLSMFTALPVLAVEETSPYITGHVEDVLSETLIEDEAFGRKEKKFRFRVKFPRQGKQSAETVVIEQSYTPETPPQLLPKPGQQFIFFRESAVDGSNSYVLVDVKRSSNAPWGLLLLALATFVIGRWYGLKPLLAAAGASATMAALQLLHLPWGITSLLACVAGAVLVSLLTFGFDKRFSASLTAMAASSLFTLFLAWVGSWFGVGDPGNLLQAGLLLQMTGGLSFVAVQTVQAIHLSYRQDPTLTRPALFQRGLAHGRASLEAVSAAVLFIFLGQFLAATYAQSDLSPGLMQLDPAMVELTTLIYLLTGTLSGLPLAAWCGANMLYRRRI